MNTEKHPKPRLVAAEMFASFMRGDPSEAPLERLPEPLREIARTEARNMAALVIFHARHARQDPKYLERLPKRLVPAVVQYNNDRADRRRRAA